MFVLFLYKRFFVFVFQAAGLEQLWRIVENAGKFNLESGFGPKDLSTLHSPLINLLSFQGAIETFGCFVSIRTSR